MEATHGNGSLKAPVSFSLMQNDQYVFLQVNLDAKEFNAAQAEPEILVTPAEAEEQANNNAAAHANNQATGRSVDFFAAPYLLKLRLN